MGAALIDLPHYARHLWGPRSASGRNAPWIEIHNRRERLITAVDGPGVLCDWKWTSDLHGARVFPGLGRLLLRRSLRDWPFRFETRSLSVGEPRVSFVLGHRGTERLPHLLTTLQSLFAQEGPDCEYIVVEQDDRPRIAEALPFGVRYVFSGMPLEGMPYSRSWAFNVGARVAKGQILILHDNDTCAPVGYAAEVLRLSDLGYDAVRLQRFVFYLSQDSSEFMIARRRLPERPSFDAISQNCEGVTIAVSRKSFFEIGGFDESFVGWGGEDNEFFSRCLTLRSYVQMYLPFIHLFHRPQGEKCVARPTAENLEKRVSIPAVDRIAMLCERDFGQIAGPDPPYRRDDQGEN